MVKISIVSVKKNKLTTYKFVRFLLVGGSGACLYFLLVYLLRLLSIEGAACSISAHLMVIAFTYVGNHQFTFRLSGGHVMYLTRFLVCNISGLFINWTLFAALSGYYLLPDTYSFAIIAIAIPIVNYLLYRFWVFHEPSLVIGHQ